MWWHTKNPPEELQARLVSEALEEMGLRSSPQTRTGFWYWLIGKRTGCGQYLVMGFLVLVGLIFVFAPLALLAAQYWPYVLSAAVVLWSRGALLRWLRKTCPVHGTPLLLRQGYDYGFWNRPFTSMMPGYFQAVNKLFPLHFRYDEQASHGMHRVYDRYCPDCGRAVQDFSRAVLEAVNAIEKQPHERVNDDD